LKKLLAAVLLLIAAAGTAGAQDLDRPLLLVAAPDLQGMYSRTALLVVPAAGGQHLGFILNRSTDVRMGTVFPEHAPSAKVVDPLYFGGPEMAGAIFAVVPRNPGGPCLRLFGDLFVGYVGWGSGELASEIERGFWYLAEPEASLLFSKDTGQMWDELVTRLLRASRAI
jgi:putative transcriptional regulator